MLKHEKIFGADDGSRLKVVVEMFTHFHKEPTYRVSVFICPKGKRTWTNAVNTDGFEYRKMNMTERAKFHFEQCCKIVGNDRITEAAIELWNSIKPDIATNIE